jgi:hypothetical protein
MTVQLFQASMLDPPILLRRTLDDAGCHDEAFLGGTWKPTKIIIDYMFGHNDFVEDITPEQAAALEPAAF